jgi:glutaredoxin 3
MKVTVYTTEYCPYCRRAVDLLKKKKADYEEVDLTQDDAKREELQKKTGWMTVPMIFIGDEFIGGADDLYALEKSGQLDKKLNA